MARYLLYTRDGYQVIASTDADSVQEAAENFGGTCDGHHVVYPREVFSKEHEGDHFLVYRSGDLALSIGTWDDREPIFPIHSVRVIAKAREPEKV